MNSIISNYYPLFEMYQALRSQLLDNLTDDDLSFRPGGENQSLGDLCREIGEVKYSYIQSFKTFRQDFTYRNQEPGIEESIKKLSAWYRKLDGELKGVIQSFSEEEIQNRIIDRGGGFIVSPSLQLEIYKEALLIFYGKTSVYLKVLGKTMPEQWQEWIG